MPSYSNHEPQSYGSPLLTVNILQTLNLFNAAGVGIVTVLSLFFGFRYPTPFFRAWTAAYTSFFMVVLLETVAVHTHRPEAVSLIQVGLFPICAWYFYQTANVVRGRFTRPLPIAALLIACTLLSAGLLFAGVSYILAAEPIFLLVDAAIVFLGVTFLRLQGGNSSTRWLAWSLIGFGLWPQLFPYALFADKPLGAVGYFICGTLNIAVGIAMVVYLVDESWRRFKVEQERQLRLHNDFVSMVSHELRTPLTSVLGYAEFLEDGVAGKLNGDQLGFVSQIQHATRSLQRLVEDLLDVSVLETGRLKLDRQSVDIKHNITAVLDSLLPLAKKTGLELTASMPPGPIHAQIDPVRFDQVLNNLVVNAIKFTPSGGRISVTLSSLPHELRLEVQDTGTGIPADKLPHVFERFYQAESTMTRKRNGVGLGLAIAKAIVEAHGGQIDCTSRPGSGSTFWFSIPMPSMVRKPAPTGSA